MSTKKASPQNDSILPESVRASAESGRLPNGYLAVARHPEMRESFATALGKLIACENRESAPCGTCALCVAFAEYGDFAITKIVREEEQRDVSIVAVRKGLEHLAMSRPFARRVFYIPEADLLSDEAADSLLKTLEEPPEKVCFVLGVPSVGRVLPTISSRLSTVHLLGDGAVVHKRSVLHDPAATLVLTRGSALSRDRARTEVIALVCDLERDLESAVRMKRPALPIARALRVASGVLDELEHGNGNLKLLLVTASVRAAEAARVA